MKTLKKRDVEALTDYYGAAEGAIYAANNRGISVKKMKVEIENILNVLREPQNISVILNIFFF